MGAKVATSTPKAAEADKILEGYAAVKPFLDASLTLCKPLYALPRARVRGSFILNLRMP
jgi:Ser/Thr protein kinase RdoA (MazF antagonist)